MSKFNSRADELLKRVKGIVEEESTEDIDVEIEETECECGGNCGDDCKCKSVEDEEIIIDEDEEIEIEDDEIIEEDAEGDTEEETVIAGNEEIEEFEVPVAPMESCECGEFECCIEKLLEKYADLPIEIIVILKAMAKAIK